MRIKTQLKQNVIAVASGGGHWEQLLMLRGAFELLNVTYITTMEGTDDALDGANVHVVPDCNRNTPIQSVLCAWAIWRTLHRLRPAFVVTTGAMPGLIALVIARMLGATTIWVDSVANAEEMSKSGRLAKHFAIHWLSQWEQVARSSGAKFEGSVL